MGGWRNEEIEWLRNKLTKQLKMDTAVSKNIEK